MENHHERDVPLDVPHCGLEKYGDHDTRDVPQCRTACSRIFPAVSASYPGSRKRFYASSKLGRSLANAPASERPNLELA